MSSLTRELATNFNRGGQVLGSLFFTTASAAIISSNVDLSLGSSSNDTIINGGTQNVFGGGNTTGTTIDGGGTQNVYGGGNTTGTTINGGGKQNVSNGGNTTGTSINNGGTQTVYDGGNTSDTTINGGSQTVYNGGNTSSTIINGGVQNVSAGSNATSTIINSGEQNVFGGIASATQIINGSQTISSGTADGTTIINGGVQTVQRDGSAINTTINSGTQNVSSTVTVSNTTVYSGGTQNVSGGTVTSTAISGGTQTVSFIIATTTSGSPYLLGTATGTTIDNGGVQNAFGTATDTTINNGTQTIYAFNAIISVITTSSTSISQYFHSGYANNTTVNNGGSQIISGGTADGTTINSGGLQIISGGTAINTTVYSGTQTIYSGTTDSGSSTTATTPGGSNIITTIYNGANASGTAINTTVYGGTQTIHNGANASVTIISSGGTQIVSGSASSTSVFNGGVQDVYGTASDTTVNSGGTLYFHNNASLTGTTTLSGGFIQLMEVGNYSIDQLTVASSGSINLTGNSAADLLAGNASDKSVGRSLTITSVNGNANFIINTDLANNSADFIKIDSGSGSHRLQVAYDPVYETRQNIKGKADFANATAGTTFTALPTDYGAYRYTPMLTSDASNIWSIIGFSKQVDSSEMVYTAVDAAAGSLKLWQRENNNLNRRLGDLRNADGKTGDWARIYKGEQAINYPNGRNVSQRYTAIQAGHDTKVGWGDGAWRAGYTVGYLTADTSYNRGSGDYSSLTLGTYATWLGGKGHYFDVVLKGTRVSDNYDCRLLNPTATKVNASYRTWGTALSAEYGRRKNLANEWYIEPHTEISLAHLTGTNYTTSDGTNIRHEGATSVVGRLGVSLGRSLRGTNFYAMVSWAREFNAKSSVSAASGGLSPVTLEKNLKENWLETAIGITGPLGGNRSGYLEISRINGDKTKTPWQINAGVRWSF